MSVNVAMNWTDIMGERGLYAFATDQENQEDLLAVAVTYNGEARVGIQKTNGAEVSLNEGGSSQNYATIGTTTPWDPTFYIADGAIRVTDGNCGARNKTKWIGYINRTVFTDTGFATTYDGWYSKDNDLATPSVGALSAVTPNEGAGFNMNIGTTGSGGSWPAGTYEYASSFLYDWNQESNLYEWGSSATHTISANDQVNIDVYYNEPYDERITGGRIYTRENNTTDDWNLLVDIDFQEGIRPTLTEDFTDWQSANEQSDTMDSDSLNPDAYQTLNGYSPFDIQAVDVGGQGEGYQAAAVVNRRAFLGNVKYTVRDGTIAWKPDRVLYSGVNRFDTFPTTQYLDVIPNDGENITALVGFADRLLVFKEKTLIIVNIAHDDPMEWFLEDTYKYKGVKNWSKVQETEQGVVWANRYGAFFYDGQNVVNLAAQYSDPAQPLVASAPTGRSFIPGGG